MAQVSICFVRSKQQTQNTDSSSLSITMQCDTSPSSSPCSTDGNTLREVAPFLKSLRRMLEDESDAVLRWTSDGRAFEIHDMHDMMARVLPKYFKHCKYTSFQRQLNYFSFRKWTKSKAVVCTFSNDFFLRDQPELAWRITRKKSLSPHAMPRYRPRPAAPYWKKEPVLLPPTDYTHMLLPGRFPSMDNDLMLKQQQSRRFYSFNMAAPVESFTTRSYDFNNNNAGYGTEQQTEPLDWIDCLLPPVDDVYNMYAYPPPYTMGSRPEFVQSTSL